MYDMSRRPSKDDKVSLTLTLTSNVSSESSGEDSRSIPLNDSEMVKQETEDNTSDQQDIHLEQFGHRAQVTEVPQASPGHSKHTPLSSTVEDSLSAFEEEKEVETVSGIIGARSDHSDETASIPESNLRAEMVFEEKLQPQKRKRSTGVGSPPTKRKTVHTNRHLQITLNDVLKSKDPHVVRQCEESLVLRIIKMLAQFADAELKRPHWNPTMKAYQAAKRLLEIVTQGKSPDESKRLSRLNHALLKSQNEKEALRKELRSMTRKLNEYQCKEEMNGPILTETSKLTKADLQHLLTDCKEPTKQDVNVRSLVLKQGFRIVDLRILRMALITAQKCKCVYGSLTIVEHETAESHEGLVSQLAIVCTKCWTPTVFPTSSFNRQYPPNYSINKVLLPLLGPNAFHKLCDFFHASEFCSDLVPFGVEMGTLSENIQMLLSVDHGNYTLRPNFVINTPAILKKWVSKPRVRKSPKKNLVTSKPPQPPPIIIQNATTDREANKSTLKSQPKIKSEPRDSGVPLSGYAGPVIKNVCSLSTPSPTTKASGPGASRNTDSYIPIHSMVQKDAPIAGNSMKTVSDGALWPPAPNPTTSKNTFTLPVFGAVKPSSYFKAGTIIKTVPHGTRLVSQNVQYASVAETGLRDGVYNLIHQDGKESILIVGNAHEGTKITRTSLTASTTLTLTSQTSPMLGPGTVSQPRPSLNKGTSELPILVRPTPPTPVSKILPVSALPVVVPIQSIIPIQSAPRPVGTTTVTSKPAYPTTLQPVVSSAPRTYSKPVVIPVSVPGRTPSVTVQRTQSPMQITSLPKQTVLLTNAIRPPPTRPPLSGNGQPVMLGTGSITSTNNVQLRFDKVSPQSAVRAPTVALRPPAPTAAVVRRIETPMQMGTLNGRKVYFRKVSDHHPSPPSTQLGVQNTIPLAKESAAEKANRVQILRVQKKTMPQTPFPSQLSESPPTIDRFEEGKRQAEAAITLTDPETGELESEEPEFMTSAAVYDPPPEEDEVVFAEPLDPLFNGEDTLEAEEGEFDDDDDEATPVDMNEFLNVSIQSAVANEDSSSGNEDPSDVDWGQTKTKVKANKKRKSFAQF